MRQKWAIGFGLLLAGLVPVSAQSQIPSGNLTAPPPAQIDNRPIPEAPIGHRQPRASEFPAETRQSLEQENARQDAELDRKIKGICKGC